MTYGNHGRGLDYARATKTGFVLGAALFAVGALAEFGLHTTDASMPTLDGIFLAIEVVGPLVALLSVFVFGIVLPLTE